MATSATIDIEALLAPVSEAAPAGDDLRQDSSPSSVYFQLKDAARAARRAEKAADEREEEDGPQGVASEWLTVMSVAPSALTAKSKDLEVAVWFLEAQLRSNGFAGLRDGFALIAGIMERYWESFHSLPADEEGLVTRLAPLAGLNGGDLDGALIQPIRKVSITVATGESGPFSFSHYEGATRNEGGPRGAVTLEQFTTSVNASGGRYYVTLIEDLEGALGQFNALCAILDAKAGRDSPPSSRIQGLLGAILDVVRAVSKDLVAKVTPQLAAEESAAQAADAPAGQSAASGNGAMHSREDALRTLLQVAEYFKNAEPQSPTAAILEETVRRARMSFAELLADLLPDDQVVRGVLTNAGIKPPPPT